MQKEGNNMCLKLRGSILLYLGCYNTILQTGWLKQQKFIYHSSGSWKPKFKVLAELVPAEASFLGLQTAAFPLCPHSFCRWPPSGVSSPSCWIRRSPLRPHLTSITFLKTLQIQSLRVRLQMINWGGDTIHSTTPKIYALKIVIFNIFPFYFIDF